MDKGSEAYKRYLKGERGAMAEIIGDYRDGLILYLNTVVGDIHLAEDLAEDTFIKLGTRRPRDKGKGSFKTWLYTIGRNIAIDCLRKQPEKVSVTLEELEQSLADEDSLEELVIKDERRKTVRRTIDKLNASYRQIIWLVYFEDLTVKQAAAVMGKKTHAAEMLLSRAREALRDQLGKDGFDLENL